MSSTDPKSLLPDSLAARVSALTIKDGRAMAVVDAAGLGERERSDIERALGDILGQRDDVQETRVVMTAERTQRRIIAVGSGKGGVGKSTLTANLAIGLAKRGHKVGLVDADIYGPSQPVILGNQGEKPVARDKKLVPVDSAVGIPVLSMGHLVEPGRALAWRGPMAGNALTQLIDAHWGDVDTLVVDLPPGTGDVQLTMMQRFQAAGRGAGLDPAGSCTDRCGAGRATVRPGGRAGHRPGREHGGLCLPALRRNIRSLREGRRRNRGRAARSAVPRTHPLDLAIREGSDRGAPPALDTGALGAPFHDIAAKVDAWIGAHN